MPAFATGMGAKLEERSWPKAEWRLWRQRGGKAAVIFKPSHPALIGFPAEAVRRSKSRSRRRPTAAQPLGSMTADEVAPGAGPRRCNRAFRCCGRCRGPEVPSRSPRRREDRALAPRLGRPRQPPPTRLRRQPAATARCSGHDPGRQRAGWSRRAAPFLPAVTRRFSRQASLVTVEQKPLEEGGELVVRIERQHVRDVLVRTNDDHRPRLAVDAAQIEDVGAVLEIGRERLLVVDQPEPALARQQKRRQLLDLEVAMPLLEDRADVDDAVDVCGGGREAADGRCLGCRRGSP